MRLKAEERKDFATLVKLLKQLAPDATPRLDLRPTPENYRQLLLTVAALEEEGEFPPDVLSILRPITAEMGGFLRASRRVCLIQRNDGAESTGIFVGPNIVLTAAHTMLGTESIFADPRHVTVKVDRFVVRPQREARRTCSELLTASGPGPAQPVVLAASIKRLPNGEVEDNGMDYIFFKIAHRLGFDALGVGEKRQTRGWMGISFIGIEATPSDDVTVLQHPEGRDQHFARGKVLDRKGFYIYYQIDARNGSSGSPILDAGVHLVGIHTGQVSDAERLGVDISAIVDDVKARFPENAEEALQGFPPVRREKPEQAA